MVHVDPRTLSAAAPNPNAFIRSTACLAHIIDSSTVWHVKATPPHDGSVALEADIARADSKVWSRLEPLAYDLFHILYITFSSLTSAPHDTSPSHLYRPIDTVPPRIGQNKPAHFS